MIYTVKQLAKLSGSSVRTLHYYDQIGLLKPARVKNNGYRLYEEKELLKLQQILFFKELDFPLEEIKRIITSPDFDMALALRDQKKLIEIRKERLAGLIKTIDKTIKHMSKKQNIKDEELYDAFKDDDVKQYQEEAKQRWGNTAAYKQSAERAKKMTKAEMEKIKKDGELLTRKLAENMEKGADSKEVQSLIAQHYKGIQFFYECPLEMYRNLGKMYVEDPRFAANYDKYRPGLAVFMRDAIAYYVDAHTVK